MAPTRCPHCGDSQSRLTLADLAKDPDRLLTTRQVAEVLGIAPQTLNVQRSAGGGPKYLKVGTTTVRYYARDIVAYVHEVVPGENISPKFLPAISPDAADIEAGS